MLNLPLFHLHVGLNFSVSMIVCLCLDELDGKYYPVNKTRHQISLVSMKQNRTVCIHFFYLMWLTEWNTSSAKVFFFFS